MRTGSYILKVLQTDYFLFLHNFINYTVCVALGVAVLIITIYCFRRGLCKKGSTAHQEFETFLRNHGPVAVRRYSYSDIKKMTNSFAEKSGQGGYGSVYRGKIHDECPVAVKVLNSSKGNGGEFINEVASISRTSHVNIVTLLGFCFEGSKRALVYEFMSNGSLEKFIYGKIPMAVENQLNCETLYQIAIGVARGLEYLHKGCNTRIFHFDIKPHNILLDEKFCRKISDFGLAKICQGNQSFVSMLEARGTAGYIAPEVFSRNFGVVSHKSDVYSFGMMVLEMVGGRKNINVEVECYSEIYFPYWVYKCLERNQELALECIKNANDNEIARKMILISLWCIQTDPSARPSMNQVVDMLEGNLESLQMPPKPFLSSPRSSPVHYSTSNLECVSVNVNL
ncbi:rust resistance kinase Lr10-like [Lotus japonicus]|uniref:rust resistance kinase Lr10-like n=1 Tax=Lotus japonicus TaxID=34305 RepID=UPI0025880809|nr:rust resistance kinase Lr10-like [Lotus japonicus]